MKVFAITDRLILRELVPEDIDGMFALDSDPEVHRYLGQQPVTDRDALHAVIEQVRQQYRDYGIGRWAVVHRETGEFMGWAGLKWIVSPTNNKTLFHDLGYRLQRKFWKQGYGRESARAALNYGFDVMDLTEVFASAHIENAGSNAILTGLGMKQIEQYQDYGEMQNWYRISRSEWLAVSQAGSNAQPRLR